MLEKFSHVGGSLLLAIVVAMVVVMVLVINRLKAAHQAEWVQMGKPEVLKFWGDYQGRWSLFGFMFSNAHAALGDGALSALVWAMRGLVLAAVVVVVMQLSS